MGQLRPEDRNQPCSFPNLRRELVNRRRQTVISPVGLALAIALVMVVYAVSAGVRNAQASLLESTCGVTAA